MMLPLDNGSASTLDLQKSLEIVKGNGNNCDS